MKPVMVALYSVSPIAMMIWAQWQKYSHTLPAMGGIVYNVGGIKSLYCYIHRIFGFKCTIVSMIVIMIANSEGNV